MVILAPAFIVIGSDVPPDTSVKLKVATPTPLLPGVANNGSSYVVSVEAIVNERLSPVTSIDEILILFPGYKVTLVSVPADASNVHLALPRPTAPVAPVNGKVYVSDIPLFSATVTHAPPLYTFIAIIIDYFYYYNIFMMKCHTIYHQHKVYNFHLLKMMDHLPEQTFFHMHYY